MRKSLKKLFGGLNMTWKATIIFAIVLGVYTALVAMLVPDNCSLHDIAVTFEWWILPAIIIIVNCKKPLEAALKTLVFFLISQPLVYLIQVPFSHMGWGLFQYYPFWFGVTLLTFPGAFIGWFIKKDKWYSGVLLSAMTFILIEMGVGYVNQTIEHFPSHLLSAIYCFAIIPVFIFAIFKKNAPRIVCGAITTTILFIVVFFIANDKPYEVYRNTILEDNNIVLAGEPSITRWSSESGEGNVVIIKNDDSYTFKISGTGTSRYIFTVTDNGNEKEYEFEYYFDKDQQTVMINRL
jgi:hypothetical protein